MIATRLVVERAAHAWLQDLGRPGKANIGIPQNGASDQHSATVANTLVGNVESASMIEITGSDFSFTTQDDALIAVTGAAEGIDINGSCQPAWQPLAVFANSRVTIPHPRHGFRNYVAVRGGLCGELVMGSVAPDSLLGVGTRLTQGDIVHSAPRPPLRLRTASWTPSLFRLPTKQPAFAGPAVVDVLVGPDLARIQGGREAFASPYIVSPQSNHVGLRLEGPVLTTTDKSQILSRGVPVGAVEVPPAGGIIILLRGRMVTAGYPVAAVVSSASLDRLGQTGPGDAVQLRFVNQEQAASALSSIASELGALGTAVREAFASCALNLDVEEGHSSQLPRK